MVPTGLKVLLILIIELGFILAKAQKHPMQIH